VINQHIFKVESRIDRDFHRYLLVATLGDLRRQTHGSGMVHITRSKFEATPVAVPPPQEQRRIVAAIEEQFSRLDAADAQLTRARRSIEFLESAFLRERIGLWPEAHLGDMSAVFVGSTPSRRRPEYWDGPVAWVSSGEVRFNRIRRTRETVAKEAVGRIHPPGTVLVAMIGEGKTRGQAAILDIPAAHNQNSAAIRLAPDKCLPEWLFYVLKARYEDTRRAGAGGQQPALNKGRVERLLVPLPPLGDQARIVAETERLVSVVAGMSGSVGDAGARSAALRRSILERAFRGELVEQNPADEPASALLERIRAARQASPTRRRTRRAAVRSAAER
jgi:type I restriction enzyme S subunit